MGFSSGARRIKSLRGLSRNYGLLDSPFVKGEKGGCVMPDFDPASSDSKATPKGRSLFTGGRKSSFPRRRESSFFLLFLSLLIALFSFCIFPHPAIASPVDIEKAFQNSLQQSKAVVKKAKEKHGQGNPIHDEIASLKAQAENIRASHQSLLEKFSQREEEMSSLGLPSKAFERHQAMVEGYKKAIEEYLSLIENLSNQPSAISDQLESSMGTVPDLPAEPSSIPPYQGGIQGGVESGLFPTSDLLDKIETHLDKILYKKRVPLFGSLPYRNLNYPSKEPSADLPIKPAYKGWNKIVSPDDTKSTDEAPISEEIANFAQSLNWNPVAIYEYVKNNIETEWYWGCMKGAEETLRQKSGNDCDQAALLISLLRASGFPSRYVRGTIEFFAGGRDGIPIDKVKNLTGIEDPWKIAEFFQKAGIPYKPVITGGTISNFEIEHMWVESQIPYGNYRGAIIDDSQKIWLGLDTSIKVKGYTYNNPMDIFQQSALSDQLSALRDEYLSTVQTPTPLEYFEAKLSALGDQQLTADSYKLTRSLIPEDMKILPLGMQFVEKKITNEYTEIPEELKHSVKLSAFSSQPTANGNQLFEIMMDTMKLSNKQIAISYEPETVEDQEIIDSYGGLDNTPAYLVRLRPVLKIDDERMTVGVDGLSMGSDYNVTIEIISPNGTEKITSPHIVGNLSTIGIVAGKVIPSPLAGEGEGEGDKTAEQLLHEEAINYIDRWNQAEDELASLLHLQITRPIPTLTTIGGVIDVTYLLDLPHGYEWKGVFLDANLRAVSVQPSAVSQNTEDRKKTFMQLSALQGSILENRIFEDDFGVESISAAKLFETANDNQTPLLTIDKTNISDVLPPLPFDDDIKEDITNAVNQNLTIRIPNQAITYENWNGIGYIQEDSITGESGYMLTGMIAGGMTVWGVDKWPAYYLDKLKNQYAEPPNYDPTSARYIQKLAVTDMQFGEAGSLLEKPLMVKVTDKQGRAVQGAEVVFKVKAGGGKLMNPGENDVVSAWTDDSGIARIYFRLGKETKANPAYFFMDTANDVYPTQVGENIIEASLGINGVMTPKPFTEYGKPGKPSQMVQTHGDGTWGVILSFAGFMSVAIKDSNNNPIANLPISFQALDAKANEDPPNCDNRYFDTKRGTLLTTTGDSCIKKAPIYGECPDAKPSIDKVLTSSSGVATAELLVESVEKVRKCLKKPGKTPF